MRIFEIFGATDKSILNSRNGEMQFSVPRNELESTSGKNKEGLLFARP